MRRKLLIKPINTQQQTSLERSIFQNYTPQEVQPQFDEDGSILKRSIVGDPDVLLKRWLDQSGISKESQKIEKVNFYQKIKNSPRNLMQGQSPYENISQLGQQSMHQKLARAILKSKLANAFKKNSPKSSLYQSYNFDRISQRMQKVNENQSIINSTIRNRKKVDKIRQIEQINLQQKLRKGDIILLNFGELQKQVEKLEAYQERLKTEESTQLSTLPYFLEINEQKQERIIQSHEVYEQYWQETSDKLSEIIGRKKDESNLLQSGQQYRNMIENLNLLKQLRNKREHMTANQYWQSQLREPFVENLEYEVYQRSSSQQEYRSHLRNNVILFKKVQKELMNIMETETDKRLNHEKELKIRKLSKFIQENKNSEKEHFVKIANEDNLKQKGKVLDIEKIQNPGVIIQLLKYQLERISDCQVKQVSQNKFLEKIIKINPEYKQLIQDNPYLIQPQFSFLKVKGESKIKLETENLRQSAQKFEKGIKYFHFKLDNKPSNEEEIILEDKNGMDIDYIKCQLNKSKRIL